MERKWLNSELDTLTESVAMKNYLKEIGVKYEISQFNDRLTHFEILVNDEEECKINLFIDQIQVLNKYLSEHLGNYSLEVMTRLSSYPDDYYLFIVKALNRNTNKYAVWTSWNTTTESLNHGHYNLTNDEADEIIKEFKH